MFPTELQNQLKSLCYGQLPRPEAEAVLLRLAQIFKEQGNKPNRGDEVAKRWQLSSGMRPAQVPGLLDLQRRANTNPNQEP